MRRMVEGPGADETSKSVSVTELVAMTLTSKGPLSEPILRTSGEIWSFKTTSQNRVLAAVDDSPLGGSPSRLLCLSEAGSGWAKAWVYPGAESSSSLTAYGASRKGRVLAVTIDKQQSEAVILDEATGKRFAMVDLGAGGTGWNVLENPSDDEPWILWRYDSGFVDTVRVAPDGKRREARLRSTVGLLGAVELSTSSPGTEVISVSSEGTTQIWNSGDDSELLATVHADATWCSLIDTDDVPALLLVEHRGEMISDFGRAARFTVVVLQSGGQASIVDQWEERRPVASVLATDVDSDGADEVLAGVHDSTGSDVVVYTVGRR